MTTRRRDRELIQAGRLLSIVLTLALGACVIDAYGASAEIVAKLDSFRGRPSKIYCSCNNIEGLDLVFDLTIENRSSVPITLYAFVWAANDEVDPPERGLWPLDAVEDCLTETGGLDVRDPTKGKQVSLKAGESLQLDGLSILQPIGWFNGERVLFRRLRVELWDGQGDLVFADEVPAPAGARLSRSAGRRGN